MKLNDEQFKALQEHIQKNWKPPVACPVCRNNNWNIADHVYELREFFGGGLVVGSGGVRHGILSFIADFMI
ncbi:MAG TPA: hypothetical protein DD725_11880 [Deltaproteobacteria bacterium]|nr:hypothetical protein [Deltaproteobacteria bacterium]